MIQLPSSSVLDLQEVGRVFVKVLNPCKSAVLLVVSVSVRYVSLREDFCILLYSVLDQ